MGLGQPFAAASAAVAALAVVTILGMVTLQRQGDGAGLPVVLYTAPHAEVAPFQRVWNPDTDNAHGDDGMTADEARSDSRDVDMIIDSLCGTDGSKCPELPAFSGEDYFTKEPIGCCHTPEQQELWSKWKSLANRVIKLEGTVKYLRDIEQDVNLKYSRGPRRISRGASRMHTARAGGSLAPMLHRAATENKPLQKGSVEGEWGVPLPL